MTESELIARQALKIENLIDERNQLIEAIKEARLHIICVGGPLNDNVLGYSKEQLKTFQLILNELEG